MTLMTVAMTTVLGQHDVDDSCNDVCARSA